MYLRRSSAIAMLAVAAALLSNEANAAHCVRGVESWDTLRIRSGPGPDAREIGRIPPGACGVNIVGGCRGWWCPVSWRGRTGWSHSSYLGQPGPFAALGMPGWGGAAPNPREPRRIAASKQTRPVRETTPIQTAAIPHPTKDAARTAPDSGTKPVPLAPESAPAPASVAAKPAPPAPAPIVVPTPQAAPVAPPPVNAVLAPAAAAAAAPPASAAAPPAASEKEACVVDVPKEDTLKVRAGPGANQALRFGFPSGACGVKITGNCADGWCPVDYRGYRGWAEQKFLK